MYLKNLVFIMHIVCYTPNIYIVLHQKLPAGPYGGQVCCYKLELRNHSHIIIHKYWVTIEAGCWILPSLFQVDGES